MIEKLIELLAPHQCIVCGLNNNVVCANCLALKFGGIDSVCVICSGITENYKTCSKCHDSALERVYVAAEYQSAAKLIKKFKFERLKAAHTTLANVLDQIVSYLPSGTLVVPVPTAYNHIRQRGYDHSLLIACAFAKQRKLAIVTPLFRLKDLRQIGSSKAERSEQAKSSIAIKNFDFAGKKVLLIDDVCTTGATLSACAKLLRRAGAGKVDAAVIAWQPPNKKD